MCCLKPLLTATALLASASFSVGVPFAVYEFVSLSGDVASGQIGVSKEAFQRGAGPTLDSSQNLFFFSFSLDGAAFSYSDYVGFGYTLSPNHKTLFAEGNLISFFPTRGVATFTTDVDGLVTWKGAFDFSNDYTVTGVGRWNLIRGASPKDSVPNPQSAQTAQVSDSGSTLLLLGLSVGALPVIGFVFRRRIWAPQQA